MEHQLASGLAMLSREKKGEIMSDSLNPTPDEEQLMLGAAIGFVAVQPACPSRQR